MTQEEIKNSGLLELYAMGALEGADRQVVEEALQKYESIRAELAAIEKSLLNYAQMHAVTPSSNVRDNLKETLSSRSDMTSKDTLETRSKTGSNKFNMFLMAATIASVVGGLFLFSNYNNLKKEYANLELLCDSLDREQNNQIAFYESVFDKENRTIQINATEKYPESELVMYLNDRNKKSYLQSLNLPVLSEDESFQLWSLKGTDAPTPLDVFETSAFDLNLLEVAYVENPDAYAITIEPKGGSTSPTLENLIGVFPMA